MKKLFLGVCLLVLALSGCGKGKVEEFNAKNEENSLSMMATRYSSNFINDLYEKAKVKDNRYLYF